MRDRYEVMNIVAISYWAGPRRGPHWVNGSPDLSPRFGQSTDALFSDPTVMREIRIFVAVNALGFAAVTLLAVWFLSG